MTFAFKERPHQVRRHAFKGVWVSTPSIWISIFTEITINCDICIKGASTPSKTACIQRRVSKPSISICIFTEITISCDICIQGASTPSETACIQRRVCVYAWDNYAWDNHAWNKDLYFQRAYAVHLFAVQGHGILACMSFLTIDLDQHSCPPSTVHHDLASLLVTMETLSMGVNATHNPTKCKFWWLFWELTQLRNTIKFKFWWLFWEHMQLRHTIKCKFWWLVWEHTQLRHTIKCKFWWHFWELTQLRHTIKCNSGDYFGSIRSLDTLSHDMQLRHTIPWHDP